MKKIKTKAIIIFSILICIILTTGCIDINEFFTKSSDDDGAITYVESPTKIRYIISYGYNIDIIGDGDYSINYSCDIPDVLHQNGIVEIISIFHDDYEDDIVATYNNVKRWDINSSVPGSYKLGIKALVESEAYIVSDLTGENALTINQIKNQYPGIFDQYIRSQGNQTTIIIDPFNSEIQSVSENALNKADTDNSFQVAKELFIWLKEKTSYERHTQQNIVQTSTQTLERLKGDCDDLSFLYIALCRSVGIPARFIKGFLHSYNNGNVAIEPHAWVEVFVGGNIGQNGWIPVECTSRSDDVNVQIYQNFGLESAGHLRLFIDDGSNESLNNSLTGVRIKYSGGITAQTSYFYNIESYEIIESKNLQIKDNQRRYVN